MNHQKDVIWDIVLNNSLGSTEVQKLVLKKLRRLQGLWSNILKVKRSFKYPLLQISTSLTQLFV